MTTALQALDLDLNRQDWTVEDVAKLPEDLHYDLIDGRLVLTPAAMPIHQKIGLWTATSLDAHCPDDCLATIDQSVLVDFRSEPRPGVVVLRERGANRTPVWAEDVVLVAEIVSPSSRVTDRDEKKKLYSYAGIPIYWIIDPLGEQITFTEFRLSPGGDYHQDAHSVGRLITIDRPWQVTLDLPAWTMFRDRIRAAARTDL
jgi:Uma2 family endonuclease